MARRGPVTSADDARELVELGTSDDPFVIYREVRKPSDAGAYHKVTSTVRADGEFRFASLCPTLPKDRDEDVGGDVVVCRESDVPDEYDRCQRHGCWSSESPFP